MLIYPPTQNGLQKTLDAQLDQGTTSSLTLNNTTGVQNKPGVVVINRIDSSGALKDASSREWISYTGVSGSTLTGLTRGLGGSTDQDHAVGSVVEFVFDITASQSIAEALATVVDETNHTTVNTTNIVTPDGSQTLENKTIDAPTITGTMSIAGAITQTGTADHITLTPGTSKLVKTAVLRQDNTTNAYKNNSVILTGWGFITGDGSNSRLAETVTFGVTFAAAPIVVIGALSIKDNSDPSNVGDFSATDSAIEWRARGIGTSSFTAEFKTSSSAPASVTRVGYSWIAIGELS